MKYIINDQECGYLLKNGKFEKILFAGTYHYISAMGYQVVITEMIGAVNRAGIPTEILMQDPNFKQRVLWVQIPDQCLAMHFVNGAFSSITAEKELLLWNVFEKNEIRQIDTSSEEMDQVLSRRYINLIPLKYYSKFIVREGECGLLYLDNKLEKVLSQGIYFYWNMEREVTCRIYDLKVQQLDISGQEILTADKVTVRLNMVCNYRISEVQEMVKKFSNVEPLIYTAVQLILREYVGKLRLDELLAQKEEIAKIIYEKMVARQKELFVVIEEIGIKDIILPGEIRDIMNTVLVAEKKAQANVIMRREEVASTRSLMNTAKLMEENQTLYKLKELEYLERICTQVGNISLSGADGILEQLSKLTM